jgi:hypothetical protein
MKLEEEKLRKTVLMFQFIIAFASQHIYIYIYLLA